MEWCGPTRSKMPLENEGEAPTGGSLVPGRWRAPAAGGVDRARFQRSRWVKSALDRPCRRTTRTSLTSSYGFSSALIP